MLSRLKVPSLAVALLTVQTWVPQTARAQEAGPQPGASAEPQAAPETNQPAAQAPAGPTAPEGAPAAAKPKQHVEEILVTGSRIRRMDLSTAAPVTVIGKDQMQASGKVSIGDFLQSLPEQSNAINTAVNNGGDGSTRVNLRGLASARTLVLVNGRRMVPGGTGADTSVDLNSIPTAAIERVEVLKDGASAVYGSDAIGGVVNLITRKDWNGTELSAFAGTSGHADGTLYDLNVTTGSSGEKGSFIFSGGFYKQAKVMAGDRSFSKIPVYYDSIDGVYSSGSGTTPYGRIVMGSSTRGKTNPTATPLYNSIIAACPNHDVAPDVGADGKDIPGTGRLSCPSSYILDPTSTTGAYANGWRPFKGTQLPEDGGDGYNFQPQNYLVTPQQRFQLYATGDTKFGDVARGYFEASYVNRQSDQLLAAEPLVGDGEGLVVSADNMYNPMGVDLPAVRRRLLEFGNRRYQQDMDTTRAVLGVDGSLGTSFGALSGWFWDLSLNYGRNLSTQLKAGSLKLPPLQAALGPSAMINGTPTCLDSAGDPIDGCVPLNLFGPPGSISQDQVRGLTYTGTQRGYNQLVSVQANTSGELFSLAADRPVGLALGYEYRGQSGAQVPDPITVAGETTGNKGEITSGSYYVNEGYGELSIPMVSGIPGIEDLEATVAARVFNYSNFGSDWTYKAGARWKIIPDLTLRGTYSTAFRAPGISDLYFGQADNFAPVKDPCRNVTGPASCGDYLGNGDTQSQLRSRVGGNPALKPETAKIFTVGVVVEPTFVEGLSLTVDYYKITMEQLISTIGESVILQSCYPSEAGVTPKYCDLITRDPTTGLISNIMNLNTNVGSLATSGIDFALRYALATEVGRFGVSFDGTWLDYYDVTQADGSVIKGKGTFDLAGSGVGGVYPAIRFNAGLTYSLSGFAAGVNMKFIGSFKECGEAYAYDKTTQAGDFSGSGLCYLDSTFSRSVPAYQLYNVYVSYMLESGAGRTLFSIGANNVFDKQPEHIYNGFLAASDPTAYDFMGRYVFARLMQTF